MKNRHLRARLPEEEYRALKTAADEAGLTISEHVRSILVRDRQALDQDQFLTKIGSQLAALTAAPIVASCDTDSEPLLAELLFLMRELVAERNAQVLGRVAHQLNTIYPDRKKL